MKTAAGLIFLIVIIWLAVYWSREQQAIYALPMVKASEPVNRVPWRLYSTCPVNRTNVPILTERTA